MFKVLNSSSLRQCISMFTSSCEANLIISGGTISKRRQECIYLFHKKSSPIKNLRGAGFSAKQSVDPL